MAKAMYLPKIMTKFTRKGLDVNALRTRVPAVGAKLPTDGATALAL